MVVCWRYTKDLFLGYPQVAELKLAENSQEISFRKKEILMWQDLALYLPTDQMNDFLLYPGCPRQIVHTSGQAGAGTWHRLRWVPHLDSTRPAIYIASG